MPETILRLSGVTKRYAPPRRGGPVVTAVHDVSATIQAGEVIALLGANGAGKSTLLRIIAGTISADKGTIERKGRVGILFGNSFGLYDRLTAREYLTYIGRLRGLSGDAVRQRIEEVATEMGLEQFLDRRCGHYSAGMRQRTAIAATILHHPELLLLDEPTTGLDIHVRRSVLASIQTLASQGHSMVISTHHPDEVRAFASRVVIIDRGEIIAAIDRDHEAFDEPNGLLTAALREIPEREGA